MKRTTKYLFSILLLGAALVSCNRMEEDVFSENPSVRLQNYTNAVYEELLSAPNGWEVRYFMNPESAGYAMIIKFNEDGTAKVAAKNSASTGGKYQEAESLWELISESGAIISFPTYNAVIHAFAEPRNDGIGLGGDYEFVVKEHSAQQMRITGRKHGAQIYMYPLPSGMAWEDYFAKIDAIDALMFTGNDDMSFNLVRNGEKQKVEYAKHMFGWVVGDTVAYVYRFITTPQGISFYYQNGVEVGDKRAQNFAFNSDNSALICTDEGIDARFESYYSAAEYFDFKLKHKGAWKVNAAGLGSETKAAYDDFVQSVASFVASSGKRTITDMRFRLKDGSVAVEINFRLNDSPQQGFITMDSKIEGDQLTLSYVSADTKANAILLASANKDVEAGKAKFKSIFEGTFSIASGSGSVLNASTIDLVDINNPNRKLKVDIAK